MKARRTTILTAALAASIAIAAGAAAALGTAPSAPVTASTTSPRDMNGRVVEFDPGIAPPEGSDAVEDTGERFRVPSVDLDVPLGVVSEVDGQITPPGFGSVYVVRNRGVDVDDAALGTVYAVTHSLRGGGKAPGNALIDVAAGKAALEIGAAIEVGDRTYEVTETRSVGKSDLPYARDLWAATPGRLVLITCLQNRKGTPSTENLVTLASLVDEEPTS